VFGPQDPHFGESAQVVRNILARLMPVIPPGGLSIVGVDDVVAGLVAAAERGDSGEHYILGGENLTYDRAVSRIAAHLEGSPARIPVPATAIHAAGPVAELVDAATGRRVFPFDRRMARLATQRLFYTSRKAHEELGYTYRPLEAHLPETAAWYREAFR
ncbi:MAG: epimerase, partial [Natronococcus sp.]